MNNNTVGHIGLNKYVEVTSHSVSPSAPHSGHKNLQAVITTPSGPFTITTRVSAVKTMSKQGIQITLDVANCPLFYANNATSDYRVSQTTKLRRNSSFGRARPARLTRSTRGRFWSLSRSWGAGRQRTFALCAKNTLTFCQSQVCSGCPTTQTTLSTHTTLNIRTSNKKRLKLFIGSKTSWSVS